MKRNSGGETYCEWTRDQMESVVEWALPQVKDLKTREERLAKCIELAEALPMARLAPAELKGEGLRMWKGEELLNWVRKFKTMDQKRWDARCEKDEERSEIDPDMIAVEDVPSYEDEEEAAEPATAASIQEAQTELLREVAGIVSPRLSQAVWGWNRTARREKALPAGGILKIWAGVGSVTFQGETVEWTHGAIGIEVNGALIWLAAEARVNRLRTGPHGKWRTGSVRYECWEPKGIPVRTGKPGRPKERRARINLDHLGMGLLALVRRKMGAAVDGKGQKRLADELGASRQLVNFHEANVEERLAKRAAANASLRGGRDEPNQSS